MTGNYDRIARFYDVDMARNMPFDDVGFYAAICRRRGGRTLELGCSNGRILLELLAQGVDAIGVDRSAALLALLAGKAAARGFPAPVARMDVRALALRTGFAVILCPYSLITYLTADDDLARLLAAVRGLLVPGGVFVVDAFVPRPVPADTGWRPDYRRPFGAGVLARWKRIVPLSPQCHRIERRYRVLGPAGERQDELVIAEEIRPFAPATLRARLVAAGFAIEDTAWDYASGPRGTFARFVTFTACPVRGSAPPPSRSPRMR